MEIQNKFDGSTLEVDDPGQDTPPVSEVAPEPGRVFLRQSRLYSESKFSEGVSEFKSIINK